MAIDIIKEEEIKKNLNFVDGYAQLEVLPGVYPMVKAYKCELKAGCSVSPKLYADKIQVFSFVAGKGFLYDSKRAYNVDEMSFYIPDFDKQSLTIHAVDEDLQIMLMVVDMLESDWLAYEDTHMTLPSFKKFSECEPYDQSCKGPHTKSWSVIHDGNLARVLMGVVCAEGEGTKEKGHPSVCQYNYTLPGSEFKLTVDGESTMHGEHDFSYVTAGLDHSLVAAPGKKVFYIWFEHDVAELKTNVQSYSSYEE
ncbi:hypothetical protein [Lachnotalea sp. AF33-28]|uniref:hypothetical protein n=1 Tax=Lachnotalea sp. AF33-28 TaxID=2292046 RepID=UPI000E495482|nr:hypothetical protein [Lachnotalea sp. AF33-28]RHP30033.1 hypothetical protein DWZ56_19715 [Lachnotalea sp. AF33-28]